MTTKQNRFLVFGTTLLIPVVLLAAPSFASPIVSYGDEGGLPDSETLSATAVRPADAIDAGTGVLAFSAFPDTPIEDIDAFHVLPNGDVIFSTTTDVTQGFGGLASFKNGDLIQWNGVSATQIFSEDVAFTAGAAPDIDAFSILSNGNWLISTSAGGETLGGLAGIADGDIVEYNPNSNTASLYLAESSIFTGANQDIDALHALPNGNVLLSVRTNAAVGTAGTYNYGGTDAHSDLIELNPNTLAASLYLDGAGLFDGSTRQLDAVFLVPEPSSASLLLFALLAYGSSAMRRHKP